MPLDPLTIIKDDADKVPPLPPGRHPLTPISYADDPRRSWRLPAQAWVIVTSAVLVFVLAIVAALWRGFESLFLRWPWLSDATLVSLLVVFLIVLAGLAHGIYGWARASAQQARVVRTAHGAPVDVGQALTVHPLVAEEQQVALLRVMAQYNQFATPNLSTMTGGGRGVEKPADPLQLPVPIDVSPIPSTIWLGWLDRVPHVMLAAETGGGKTTMATHILASRLNNKEQVFIIDPGASGWGGLPSIGGGEHWGEVRDGMESVIALYSERQQERRRYLEDTGDELAHDYFQRLNVVFDEAFIAQAILNTGKHSIWKRFVPILGSGARKVGISIILLTQTANVEDLKISGPLRENYTRIALDSGAAVNFIQSEEPDRERKQALLAALAGMAYPAVTEREGRVLFLDRSGLAQMPNLRSYRDVAWQPGKLVHNPTPQEVLEKAIREAKARNWTRDQARAAGLHFDNGLWSQITGEGA